MLNKTKRIIDTALLNFWRNGWLSLTTTLIMSLALVTVGVFFILLLSTNRMTHELQNKIDIIINFKDTTSEGMIQEMKSYLLSRPNIKSVRYISKEDALSEFKSRNSVRTEIREIVTPQDNPLPRGLQITSVSLNEFEEVDKIVKDQAYSKFIDSSSYNENKDLIKNINNAGRFVERFGFALSLVFIVISALVVFNTVKLAVIFRAKEIEIMRLVGASESYVKMPFLIEGFLYGLFATIISELLIYSGVLMASRLASGTVFSQYMVKLSPIYYEEFWFIFIVQIAIATIIGVGASYFSIRKNVKV